MDEFSPEQLDVDKILKVLKLKKKLENIGKKKLNKIINGNEIKNTSKNS
jgi:hypothetical protein